MLILTKNIKIHKYFKNIVMLLLLCFLLCLPVITKATIVEPTNDFYVNDYANILNKETEQYIQNTNIELQQKTGAQIVVVTVKSLDGMDIEQYANQLFRKFGIGDKEKNNGLLLLCSYEDRQFRVEVGYGLEGALPDGKTGRMQDEYIIPYLKENKFDEGIKNGYSAFLQEVSKEYNITITGTQEAEKQTKSSGWNMIGNIIFIIFIIIIFSRFRGGPFIFLGGLGGGSHGGFGGGGGFSGGGFSRRWRLFRWRRKLARILKDKLKNFFDKIISKKFF